MESYHVYFSAREGVARENLVAQVHKFMETQVRDNKAVGYRVIEMTNKASFGELPDFHLIVDYQSGDDLKAAFDEMKNHFRSEPHAPLMKMVSDFRVAFSIDAEA